MQSYSFPTADTIISAAKAEAIGSSTSSLTALQDEQLLATLNRINVEFVNSAHTRHPLGGWSWMRKATNFQTKDATTLDGAVAAGASSLDVASASDLDSSGRIVIQTAKGALDFVDYSSIASQTLTVSTPETVSMAHADAEPVEKLYPIPSDYSKVRTLYVNSSPYDYERFDQFPQAGHFTTYGAYILMPKGIGQQDCTLYYEAKADTIDGLMDELNIPVDYSKYAIEKLKAHIYLIRRKRSDVKTALDLAEECLQYTLSMDTEQQSNSEYTRIPLPY